VAQPAAGMVFILIKASCKGIFLIMTHLNIEIKAKCQDPEFIRKYLQKNNAEFKGTDHQTDTYFNVGQGRLKLREGNIENNLIFYERNDQPDAKESNFQLINISDRIGLKDLLTKSLGIKVIVKKSREIYFIANVKFHIDEVDGLGSFAEIEASNLYAKVSREHLQGQCEFYLREFRINNEDLISVSYSDMMITLKEQVQY
jgi:predicted adenylyl cyclase CyaB